MVHIESKESPTILPFHVVRECVNFFTLLATASPPHLSLHSRLSNSKQQTFFHVGWVSSIQQPFSKNYFADITIKTLPSRDQCSKSYLNFFKACVLSKLRGSQILPGLKLHTWMNRMTFLGGGGPVFHRECISSCGPSLEPSSKLSSSYIFDIKDYESVFILINSPWT